MSDTRPSAHTIVEAIAETIGVDPEDVMADHRGSPEVARVRWMAFAVYRDLRIEKPPKLAAIGRAFGRDRTTVRHGLRRFLDECAADRGYVRAYQSVVELLG